MAEGGERIEDTGCRITFWNVNGKALTPSIQKEINNWDVVVLQETHIEYNNFEEIKDSLPKEFEWNGKSATRNFPKGHAMGGMLIGQKKRFVEEEEEKNADEEPDWVITKTIRVEDETWTIMGVYLHEPKSMEKYAEKLEWIRTWIENRDEEERVIIGGDFNAHTGKRGGLNWGDEGSEWARWSMDEKEDERGREVLELLRRVGWGILNGRIDGDGEGAYTFQNSKSDTVIDYVIMTQDTRAKVDSLEVGNKKTSDHCPLILALKQKKKLHEEEKQVKIKSRFAREVDERRRFSRELELATMRRKQWKENNSAAKTGKNMSQDLEEEEEEWKKDFMGLLRGVEDEVVKEAVEREEEDWQEREKDLQLSWKEITEMIDNLRENEATGKDRVLNGPSKFGKEKQKRKSWKICSKVCNEEALRQSWKEGVLVPVMKQREGKKVEEYTMILTLPLYEIYSMSLLKRLQQEVKDHRMILPNQTGFSSCVGRTDSIYVLNYLVNRQLTKTSGKLIALFINFEAAFDSVDREVLWIAMKKRGVSNELQKMVKETYRETTKGLRKGCPLSPILFDLLIADMEEVISTQITGGVSVARMRICTLVYEDHVVLLAEDEHDMKPILSEMKTYLKRKKLKLNMNETKFMRFAELKPRNTKNLTWNWEGKTVKKVDEFTYLGYTLESNGKHDAHIKKRVEKAWNIMRQVRDTGNKVYRDDYEGRLWLFDTLVWTVMGYGAEIFGWEERKEIEDMHEKFLKWTVGKKWTTPGDTVRDRHGRPKLRNKAVRSAWAFEERLRNREGGDLARLCLEDMKLREELDGKLSEWEKGRKEGRKHLEEERRSQGS